MRSREVAELIRDQRPLTMPPETTLSAAAQAMHQRRVGAVLVTDPEGRLLGIFTGRDALRCLATGRDAATCTLAEVMTRNPQTIGPHATAMDALRLMNDMGVRHLPIVEEGRVVGIVSRYDFRAMEHRRLDEETGFFEILR
ncbi:MAG: CBS domain-containing protein [Rhodovarius sp.]|nr:CBS domain-containing protein [Rhodovarius sp.]MCX8132667.1 CBS domain-containing protein [Roseococcus sp.]MDW8315736.1 CBS domain-containing protein [Rhodovarius sp.]